MMLGDMGAEVLKIERPEVGDPHTGEVEQPAGEPAAQVELAEPPSGPSVPETIARPSRTDLESCITVLLAQHNRFVLAFRDEQSTVGKQAAEVLRAAGRPGHLEAGLRCQPEAEQEARVAAR